MKSLEISVLRETVGRHFALAQDFVEVAGVGARRLARRGDGKHADCQQTITASHSNLIARLYNSRRLGLRAADPHLPGLTQLLRHSPPQTQTARFKKKVNSHKSSDR